MAQRPVFDLLVIGADTAGHAAAAAAARLGASAVIVATGNEPRAAGFKPSPPNFLWRLLDLHRHDLKIIDAGRTVTYLGNGDEVSTLADKDKTARLLSGRNPALEYFWPDFIEAMARARVALIPQTDDRSRRPAIAGLTLADASYASAIEVLDDRFTDEGLKAHLLMMALAPLGLAGDEAGSATALFDFAAADPGQRIDAEALHVALVAAAKEAGATLEPGNLVRLARQGDRTFTAHTADGGQVRARRAIASSALTAEAAGLLVVAGGSPLRRQAGVEATIRLRYAKKPRVRTGDGATRHHILADKRSLARARDAMLEGRIDEAMPLSFEIRGRDVIARAAFAPARIRENGSMRDWTGQDLQILARAAASAIGRRLDPAAGAPQAIDATLGPDAGAGLRKRDFSADGVVAPTPSADAVGAAAALAMSLVRP